MARINIESMSKPGQRKSIDAAWTKKQKMIAAAFIGVLGIGGLGYGAISAWNNRAPALPTTVDEAIALVNSTKLDNLDPDRQEQYLNEAATLLKDLPDEERRKLFRDEKNREALDRIREQQMDEMARKFAKGEQPDWMKMRGPGMPGMGPGGPGREGGGGGNGNGGGGNGGGGRNGGGGAGRGDPDARRAAMDQRMAKTLNSGNAQSVGLRGEMMKRMMTQRQAAPSQSGGGGGGGPK